MMYCVKMMFKVLVAYLVANIVYVNGVDYCALKCKRGNTMVENSACKCDVHKSACGANVKFFPPDEETKNYIVQVHNEYREKVASGKTKFSGASNMNALAYSDALEHTAACWNKRCTFKHDKCRITEMFKSAGQNLFKYNAINCGDKELYAQGAEGWFGEIEEATLKCLQSYDGCSGHFTQMIWAKTTHIGCSKVEYGRDCQVACNYGPAGNMIGAAVYKEGSPTCKKEANFSSLCKSAERQHGGRANLESVPTKPLIYVLILLIFLDM